MGMLILLLVVIAVVAVVVMLGGGPWWGARWGRRDRLVDRGPTDEVIIDRRPRRRTIIEE